MWELQTFITNLIRNIFLEVILFIQYFLYAVWLNSRATNQEFIYSVLIFKYLVNV